MMDTLSPKQFDFGGVLGYGWQVMKANFWFFAGVLLVSTLLPQVFFIMDRIAKAMVLPEAAVWIIYAITTIAGYVITYAMQIGIIKIALSFCDERKPAFGTLFAARGCFWRFVGTLILQMLIVLGGLILLIVPGIIWGIKFSQATYFVIDKGMRPIEALKASARTTYGVKWKLLGFWIVCMAIMMAGMLCLLVGIFAAWPVVMVAQAMVYRQLAAQSGFGGEVVPEFPNLSDSGTTA
jgi:uncharacterized membrane protein